MTAVKACVKSMIDPNCQIYLNKNPKMKLHI